MATKLETVKRALKSAVKTPEENITFFDCPVEELDEEGLHLAINFLASELKRVEAERVNDALIAGLRLREV